jgi:hypothetical protein
MNPHRRPDGHKALCYLLRSGMQTSSLHRLIYGTVTTAVMFHSSLGSGFSMRITAM